MIKFLLNDFIRNFLWVMGVTFTIVTSIIQVESTVPEVGGLNLWWWVAIAFILAIVVTGLQHFIRRGKSTIIELEVQRNDLTEKLYADVTNKGTEGVFEAQFRIIESSDFPLEANQGIYRGYWEENRVAEMTIRHGETKRLLIAEFRKGSFSSFLRIFGESFGGYHQLSHGYPIGGSSSVVIPEVSLILTISTSPMAWRGSKVLRLRIWADNRYEVDYRITKEERLRLEERGLAKTQFRAP
jgi:hypothetical protein